MGRIQPTFIGVKSSIDPKYHGHPSSKSPKDRVVGPPFQMAFFFMAYIYIGGDPITTYPSPGPNVDDPSSKYWYQWDETRLPNTL